MPRTNPKAETLRKRVKEWKARNPHYMDSEAYKEIQTRGASASKIKKLRFDLPYFFAFIDMSPDQVIELRKQQIAEDNDFFEKKMYEFKAYLISLDYGKESINSMLGNVAAFFSNYSNKFTLDLPKSFWKKEESKKRKSEKRKKKPPTNEEIKLIYEAADRKTRIAILFGYQAGLAPTDIVKLSWANIGTCPELFNGKFSYVEHTRNKSEEEGLIILNPDLLTVLKGEWLDQGKPVDGEPILNYRGEPIQSMHPNIWFKDVALKVLGEKRAADLTFYSLRHAFNNVIKTTPDLKQETVDRLMGHSVQGSRQSYYVEPDYMVQVFREKLFDRLTVNGWRYEQKALEFDQVSAQLEDQGIQLTRLTQRLNEYEELLKVLMNARINANSDSPLTIQEEYPGQFERVIETAQKVKSSTESAPESENRKLRTDVDELKAIVKKIAETQGIQL